jgi:SPP1 gp7 family putative phage head morphogenesis protein
MGINTGKLTSPEIATRQAALWSSSLWNQLPNPDAILRKTGKNIGDYRELLYDPHTGACVQSRKAGALKLEWMLRSEENDATIETVRACFERLNLYNIIESILDAPLYGFQPLEILWEVREGFLLPSAVVAKPPEWFMFDVDGNLRLKTKDSTIEGVELPPYRFLVVQHRPTYLNPYGEAVLARCYWAQFFKRNVQRFWNTFTEKFGTPFISLKHEFGNNQAKVDEIVRAVSEMAQDAVIALPAGASAEIMSVSGVTNTDIYKEFLSFCNAEISKAILGQTLSTEMSSTGGGSYAATKVHFDVQREIIEADKRLVEQSLNTLIAWIYTLNVGASARPAKFILFEQDDVDKTLAERDKILFDTGVRFQKSYYSTIYGLKESDFELAPNDPPPPPTGAFPINFASAAPLNADAVQDGLEESIMKTDTAEWERQAQGLIRPIAELIRNASSFDDVKRGLVKTFSAMDTKRLQERLAAQLALMDVLGAQTIEAETNADFADFADDVPPITPARIALAFTMKPDDALAFLYGKESEIFRTFKGISPEVFRVVFTVAGVAQMDVLVAIRALVEKALEEGQSFEEFKKAMTENELIARTLPESRFQTIYRTNLQSAFMAARFRQQTAIGERKPYWKFVAVMDKSTTPGCRELDGKVFRFDDNFWNTNYPPRHYKCRSRVVALNERELQRYGGTVESGDDYQHVQPDPSFATTPDAPFQPRASDYPPDIWAEYQKQKR